VLDLLEECFQYLLVLLLVKILHHLIPLVLLLYMREPLDYQLLHLHLHLLMLLN
tara:strand:+ start:391 stop:552 length:162 start_codon:yes stop_codon:yes gene_type:complete